MNAIQGAGRRLGIILVVAGAVVSPVMTPEARAAEFTDPQIAAIVVAANSVDVDAGKLAQGEGSNSEVKAFATNMVTDHTAVNKSAADLVHKLGVTPEENATSKKLKSDGAAMLKKLQGMKGAAFDKAYIDNEVAYHQAVLDVVDNNLIPDAKNAELKALLQKARPTFVEHLAHAKKIQTTVKAQ